MIPGGMPGHGETRNIKVIIEGVEYDAQLKNQGFDRNKYDGHVEVVQIRYNMTSRRSGISLSLILWLY